MARKSLGYVELEWTCPNCGSINPGSVTVCQSCGAAQPADVEFHQPAEEKLVEDEEKLARAEAGPDIHCAYCGARNPATNTLCRQCGAELSEGAARESGQVLGAHRDQPAPDVACPYCGEMNPATAKRCANCNASLAETRPEAKPDPKKEAKPASQQRSRRNPMLIYAIVAVVVIACAALAFLFLRTDEVVGEVTGAEWERIIVVEGLGPVEKENWREEIPAEANILECEDRLYETQDEPAPDAREVCGTPYTVDEGSGFGQVVQDCEYEIYEPWCEYTVQEWVTVDEEVTTGSGFSPQWPEMQLGADQRAGEEEENYYCYFDADGEDYTYTTSSLENYRRCEIGSRWTLNVNAMGGVVSIEPAQ